MNRIKRDSGDLAIQFKSQIDGLQLRNKNFDDGFWSEAMSMATIVSNLVLDRGRNSKSILTQVGIKDKIKFLDTARPKNQSNLIHEMPRLVYLVSGAGQTQYLPYLHNSPFEVKKTSFEKWRNETAIDDFTREKVIVTVRDTDGGSHVDQKIDKDYNDMKWGSSGNRKKMNGDPIIMPHYPTIRQISYELLVSIEDYLEENEINRDELS